MLMKTSEPICFFFRETARYPWVVNVSRAESIHLRPKIIKIVDGDSKFIKRNQVLLVLNVGNGWVAGGCWDDYY